MNDVPGIRHHVTARPVSAEEERAATERAIQAALASERARQWFVAHSTPDPDAAALQARIVAALAHHQPIDGEGGPYCQTCTQEEIQPAPTGWWMTFPCPTVTALTGHRTSRKKHQ